MNVEPLALPGVYRATPRDKAVRAFNWYRTDALAPALPAGWAPAVGSVHTVHRGEISGLHVERGHRVVTCVTGHIAFVAVDVREGRDTFGRWIPIDLEPIDRPTIVIPPGVAWGYQGFSDIAVLLALHEGLELGPAIDPVDDTLEINWPLPVRSSGLPLEAGLAQQPHDG